ncbi:hypothetical protein CDV31_009182 [Fusarium ambrosium]|uniref:Oxidoreductase acuF-like C2H2 type zinc-finger domain-containing protein n=1 Tax=Fusarium ambrosium TaxID=131363 RepID=A0A428TWF7_9HYPO|nr:hypothetical protein CDV31_009182 [Fusarium ambrosium]
MPTSFLSRRDIERWVPDAAASKSSAGFIGKLSSRTSTAIASLRTALFELQDDASRMCQNELERFLLWCQGLSVADGHLDEVLPHSSELHPQVLSLLLRLGTVILQAISQVPGELSHLQVDECDHLRALLDVVETMLKESESDEHEESDTPSESDTSDHGFMEIMEEISAYIDCLLDLAPALDNPALDIPTDEPKEALFGSKESFTTSCEEALIYCHKIRDRFDGLPKYLVERLAEANVCRAARIRQMQRQVIMKETSVNDGITESLFSGQDPQVTETTKSSVPPSSVFSSVLASSSRWSIQPTPAPKRVDSAEFDDNASEATFASLSTAASSFSMGRPRIPPMPDVEEGGFDCTLCYMRLTDVVTRKEWKRHVFSDLHPYMCTVEGCQKSGALYSHSREWARHESSHLSAISRPSECAFCSASYQEFGLAYFKHVSGHLREVSLSVLPQTTDDDQSRTDDSDASLLAHQDQGGETKNSSKHYGGIARLT